MCFLYSDYFYFFFFFFCSSRRRHTRLQGDRSSDVCSSDLSHGHDRSEQQTGQPHGHLAYEEERQDAVRPVPQGEKWRVLSKHKEQDANQQENDELNEIGRASCRERVEIRRGGGVVKKEKKR